MGTRADKETSARMSRDLALRIQLNKRAKIWSDVLTQKAALDQFPNAQVISPILSYETAIQGLSQVQAQSAEAERAILIRNLNRIVGGSQQRNDASRDPGDGGVAGHIVKQLTDSEVSQTNAFFPDIYRELRRTTAGGPVSPGVFIAFVRRYLSLRSIPIPIRNSIATQMDGTDVGPVAAAAALEAQTVLANTAAEQAAEDMGEALVQADPLPALQNPAEIPDAKPLNDRDSFAALKNLAKAHYILQILAQDNTGKAVERLKKKFPNKFSNGVSENKINKANQDELLKMFDALIKAGFRNNVLLSMPYDPSNSSSSTPQVQQSAPRVVEVTELESPASVQGSGFRGSRLGPKPRRVVYGSGVRQEDAQSKRFYLSDEHFRKGQLCVKYSSTGKMKIRPIVIDAATKRCILDVIAQHPDREARIAALAVDMRRIVQMFRRTINNPQDEIHDADLDKLFDDWQIFRGEYTAGNTGPAIRRGLRQTTMELMQIKRISQNQGMQVLAMLGVQD